MHALKNINKKDYPFKSINQTLITNIVSNRENIDDGFFMYKEYCPQRIFYRDIAKLVDEVPTESQYKGLYFESLLLDKEAKTIPLTKTGKVPIDYERIQKQATNAQLIFLKNGISVSRGINTQVPLSFYHKELDIVVKGKLDLFPAQVFLDGELKKCIVDIKLTGNVDDTFSPYSWGDPTKRDNIQGDMYMWLVRNVFQNNLFKEVKERNKDYNYCFVFNDDNIREIVEKGILFFYFVFGYKESEEKPLMENVKIIERVRTEHKEYQMLVRMAQAIEALRIDEDNGWKAKPSQIACDKCPLKNIVCNEYLEIFKC